MSDRPLYVGPLLHLRTLPAFEGLSPAQLRDLAYEAQEVLLPRGSRLVDRGRPGAAMHLIVDGFVETGDGAVVGPGGVVGFLDALTREPAPASALADTDVVALRLETDALRDVCEQNFPVLSALLTYVAAAVAEDREAWLRAVAGPPTPVAADVEQLDRVARILALRRAPAFPSDHMDALAELAGHVREARLESGTALLRAGDPPAGFFLVCSGSARVTGPDWGEEVELGPGSVPGLLETLSGRPHPNDVSASSSSVLLEIGDEPFLDVIEDHFEMAFGLLGWLAGQVAGRRAGRSLATRTEAEDGRSGSAAG